jgi:type II secretory pathway component PulM
MSFAALLGCQLIAGCTLFVTGAVVGVGAYTYVNGELKRSYQAAYDKTVQASLSAVAELNIDVRSVKKQGLKTTIDGNFNGKPITTSISRVDVNISEVGVRSGYVGVWEKDFSREVHEQIAQRLQS